MDPCKAPFTFQDVAAYFSEKEWKLLHEWQKELYRNMIKKVHQALISLGYQIVKPDTLLRIYKSEKVYIDVPLSPEKKTNLSEPTLLSQPPVNPDLLLRIKQEEKHNYPLWPEERFPNNAAAPSPPPANPDLLLRIKHEEGQYYLHCPEDKVHNNQLADNQFHSSEILLKQDVADNSLMDPQSEEGAEHSSESDSEHEVISFIITDEEDEQSADPPDSVARGSGNSPKGEESTKRKRKFGSTVAQTKRTRTCKGLNGKVKEEKFKGAAKDTDPEILLSSASPGDQKGASQCESGSVHPGHSTFCPDPPKLEKADIVHGCDSNLSDANSLSCQQNTLSVARPFACAECGNNFRTNQDLTRHQRIHSGERPYHCTVCDKSFSRKHHLTGHQRSHTGERPYQCSECEKTFSWRENLNKHMKKHMVNAKPLNWEELFM
ncbi:zinc finger protein 282-like [Ambystoma mexicanum]|uniref:zinc finger protein 282-like n=1 Tax=Ambystoma mexicanum TaxID=8296 RepID=UPI0037E7DA92